MKIGVPAIIDIMGAEKALRLLTVVEESADYFAGSDHKTSTDDVMSRLACTFFDDNRDEEGDVH